MSKTKVAFGAIFTNEPGQGDFLHLAAQLFTYTPSSLEVTPKISLFMIPTSFDINKSWWKSNFELFCLVESNFKLIKSKSHFELSIANLT